MNKLPFGWLPGHWGLKGETREIARIEYEYDHDHYKRDRLVARVRHHDDKSYEKQLLVIDLEHNKITQHEYEDKMLDFIDDESAREQAALEMLYERGEITELEYTKEKATREGLPWFHLDVDYANGELELVTDWNQAYIDMLRDVGYKGSTDGDVIDEYVRDFGRKLSTDDDELEQYDSGLTTFIKSERNGDMVSYQ